VDGVFGHVDTIKLVSRCHQMPDFKAKMHKFAFRRGSAPDPLIELPRPSNRILQGFTSKGSGDEKRREEIGKGREEYGGDM